MPVLAANKWFVDWDNLDEDQKHLARNGVFANGGKVGWVLGPAGSGKTIVLVHALEQALKAGKSVVFISYTKALLNLAHQGLPAGVKAITFYKLNEVGRCDFAVVDEVQDIPAGKLKQICSMANQVILAGDETQRIYDTGATKADILTIASHNSHRLTKTYRLTPKVFAAARQLYPEALEGTLPSGKTVTDIELFQTAGAEQGKEVAFKIATDEAKKGQTAAILLPTNKGIVSFANWALRKQSLPEWTTEWAGFNKPDYRSLNSHLLKHNVPLQVVQNGYGDLGDAFSKGNAVLQTYHSSKGLDYACVCLPNISVEDACKVEFQKALFFVAITRASGFLSITYSGAMPPFLKKIESFCTPTNPERVLQGEDDGEEF